MAPVTEPVQSSGTASYAPPSPAAEDLYSRLVRTRDRLQGNNSTLDSIVNRIVGPEPASNSPEAKRPGPPTISDLLGDIECLVQRGDWLAQRAHQAIGLP